MRSLRGRSCEMHYPVLGVSFLLIASKCVYVVAPIRGEDSTNWRNDSSRQSTLAKYDVNERSSDSTVAIRERMDAFKLGMDDGSLRNGWDICS